MSAYLGGRGLQQLREQLSERDLAVISSVNEHRFLAARQIEELHFHDHSTGEAGARVCRRVLARLSRDRLLARTRRRVGGVRAGSASFIYALGPIGSRLIHEQRRRFTEPSRLFLDHTLAIADARIELLRAARRGRLELVEVQIEPACWRRYTGASGAAEVVKPDLYVVTATGAYEDCWFLEIDRGTESSTAIARKCRNYELYFRSGVEQQKYGTFPLIIWIAADEARAKRLGSAISSKRQLKQDLFRVTTSRRLVELIAGGAG